MKKRDLYGNLCWMLRLLRWHFCQWAHWLLATWSLATWQWTYRSLAPWSHSEHFGHHHHLAHIVKHLCHSILPTLVHTVSWHVVSTLVTCHLVYSYKVSDDTSFYELKSLLPNERVRSAKIFFLRVLSDPTYCDRIWWHPEVLALWIYTFYHGTGFSV